MMKLTNDGVLGKLANARINTVTKFNLFMVKDENSENVPDRGAGES